MEQVQNQKEAKTTKSPPRKQRVLIIQDFEKRDLYTYFINHNVELIADHANKIKLIEEIAHTKGLERLNSGQISTQLRNFVHSVSLRMRVGTMFYEIGQQMLLIENPFIENAILPILNSMFNWFNESDITNIPTKLEMFLRRCHLHYIHRFDVHHTEFVEFDTTELNFITDFENYLRTVLLPSYMNVFHDFSQIEIDSMLRNTDNVFSEILRSD